MAALHHQIAGEIPHLARDLKLHVARTHLVDQGQVDMGLHCGLTLTQFDRLTRLFQVKERRLIQQRQHRGQRGGGVQMHIAARRTGQDVGHLEDGAADIDRSAVGRGDGASGHHQRIGLANDGGIAVSTGRRRHLVHEPQIGIGEFIAQFHPRRLAGLDAQGHPHIGQFGIAHIVGHPLARAGHQPHRPQRQQALQ